MIGVGVGIGFNQRPRKIIVRDTFNRADSATLGVSETGQIWSSLSGGFGIVANAARGVGVVNHIDTISAAANGILQVILSDYSGNQAWLNFRVSDFVNRWRFGVNGGNIELQKIVAGAVSNMFSVARTVSSGNKLVVTLDGSKITLFHDGTTLGQVTDSFNSTVATVGIQTNNSNVAFDNFIMEA